MKPYSPPSTKIAGRIIESLVGQTPEDVRIRARKRAEYGFLERICESLDPTQSQRERAESAYVAVGDWLAGSSALSTALVYLQGSEALGTTNKPIYGKEHDVDLICHLKGKTVDVAPSILKKIVGDRLREHGTYAPLLEEMLRCWRLNFKGEFHLDITPSIPNPSCPKGGEFVPDKKLKCWKASNPKGYLRWFLQFASFEPAFIDLNKAQEEVRAEIEAFPNKLPRKGILRRVVQLLKRHRDEWFAKDEDGLAPISIIITTLAAFAYHHCVTTYQYDNELDLLCDTIRFMPYFIEPSYVAGLFVGKVMNPTTDGENFAEKWESDPRKAQAYREWNAAALATFEQLSVIVGRDAIAGHLSKSLGSVVVESAVAQETEERSTARGSGRLTIAPVVGLVANGMGTPIRANTFFGRK